MAVADVYDALISQRDNKPGVTHDEAAAIISDGAGSHIDPDVCAAFLEMSEELQAIARRYADPSPEV